MLAAACLLLSLTTEHAHSQGTRIVPESVTLQLRWKHQFQFAGYYAAQQQGYYADANLDVQIVEAQEGVDPIGTVVNGGAQFGVGTSELVLWRSRGERVVVLGVIFQHSPLVLLTTRQSGLDNLHALTGKKIAIEANSAELLAYLQDEGIDTSQLQVIEHGFSPDAFLSGAVDATSAYSTDEPFLVRDAGLDYQMFSPRAAGIDFYGDVLFTTEDYLNAHPHQVQAFLDASLKGWEYAFAHQDELIDYIYSRLTQRHSREHLQFEAEQMRRLIQPDLIKPGYMYEGRWRYIAETYARVGLIPDVFPVKQMLYQVDPEVDFTPLYTSIGIGAVIALLIGFISLRFYRLNRTLHSEIDKREQIEQQLRASENQYRSLVETAPFPVVISRLTDNTLRYCNPRAEEKLRFKSADLIGKPVVNFYVHAKDRNRMTRLLDESGFVQDLELQMHNTAGEHFWVLMSAVKFTYEGYPALFVSFNDVTERRQMEMRLRESEELYRSILHASPDGVTITDMQGQIVIVSPASVRLRGYTTPEALIGQPFAQFALPEHQQRLNNFIRHVPQGSNAQTIEYTLVRLDGSQIIVETSAELIRNPEGEPARLVFITRDITERKQAEADALALAVQQERVNVLTAFIQNASHEFRTPLAIIGSSTYLMQKSNEPDKQLYHTRKIEEQVNRITRLVDQLLEIALLDSGQPISLAPTNLADLIRRVISGVQPHIDRKQLTLELDLAANVPLVKVDVEQLQSALLHLLDNAIRYTASHGSLGINLYQQDSQVIIEVCDTGVGISDVAMPHIFERFWRHDDPRNTPGFGLGLSLVQKIAAAHHGSVSVESTPGSGSIFRIILPIDPPPGLMGDS